MKVKLSFVFIALFVVLLSICGTADSFAFQKTFSGAGFNISALPQSNINHHVNFNSNRVPKIKNNVRIKALHDYSAIDIATTWEPSIRIEYFYRAAFKSYCAYFLSAHFTKYNLRGPPSVNS